MISWLEQLKLGIGLRPLDTRAEFRRDSGQIPAVLRGLPRVQPPADLTLRLRILASKECQADRRPATARWRGLRDRASLALDNLMKPIALPAVGGLCSAVVLFMTMAPMFHSHLPVGDDVPLVDLTPSTEPALKSVAPIGFSYGDAEVDLRIDQHGRLISYSIVNGPAGIPAEALRRSIQNNLLFTTFTPATSLGVPISGTLRLSFRSSRVDVKG